MEAWLRKTIAEEGCSRHSLVRGLCKTADWRNAKGDLCLGSARRVLPDLAELCVDSSAISARHVKTRFPGKPLEEIRRASGAGRALIRWTWEAASEERGINRTVVATDDWRICDEVNSFGGEAVVPQRNRVLRRSGR